MRLVRYAVAREQDLVDGVCITVPVGDTGESCGIARCGGATYAFGALCPHQNAPLTGAPVEHGVTTCLRHGYRFDLKSGDCLTIGGYGIPVFPTETIDGTIFIDVWQDDGSA